MTKKIYNLTSADLARHPVWAFSADETGDDDTSVRPAKEDECLNGGLQLIVRCIFRDHTGREFQGYLYDGEEDDVDYVKPVLWIEDLCLTFWNGVIKPNAGYLDQIRAKNISWPLSYKSEAVWGLVSKTGILAGLYFLDGEKIRCVAVKLKRFID